MLKIQCPECNKNFLWTDDMPEDGKCPAADCNWQYNIHAQLKQNIAKREMTEIISPKKLFCPSCNEEIAAKFTICRHCGMIVMGGKFFKKTSFFLVICIILIVLSLILKYVIK